ncbi:unnamed protein product [Scytosiphon promiscuus]
MLLTHIHRNLSDAVILGGGKSVENHFQENHRASRDEKSSRCVVVYRPWGVSRQAFLSGQDGRRHCRTAEAP